MLANNLANVETGGFKADREFYSLYISEDAAADPHFDGTGTLPVVEKQWTDHTQGTMHETSNPLDVGLDGAGFLAVNTAAGIRYTRNGSLRVSAKGLLTTTDGNPLRSVAGGEIAVQPGQQIEILTDGTVQQKGQTAGKLALVSFDPGNLNKSGANYFAAASGAKTKPAAAQVLQGKLEGSNVAPAESAVRLVSIMRQFEMLQKAMTIGNEMNRKAVEEVARVNG